MVLTLCSGCEIIRRLLFYQACDFVVSTSYMMRVFIYSRQIGTVTRVLFTAWHLPFDVIYWIVPFIFHFTFTYFDLCSYRAKQFLLIIINFCIIVSSFYLVGLLIHVLRSFLLLLMMSCVSLKFSLLLLDTKG